MIDLIKVGVTGGKGGTGKSTIAVNLAVSLLIRGFKLILADLDVEGCVDSLLLNAKQVRSKPIKVMIPYVSYGKCNACGECVKVCDTGALISVRGGKPFLIPRLCSGCGACYYACREHAILRGWRVIGSVTLSEAEVGYGDSALKLTLVTGRLKEGEEHVAPAVIASREEALKIGKELGVQAVIIDTAAGTGLAVSTALSVADVVVAVTEPTPLGAHDLRGILELTSRLGIPSLVVINKFGIASEDVVVRVCREFNVDIVARLPYDRCVVDSYVKGRPAVTLSECNGFSKALKPLTDRVAEYVLRGE